MGEPRLTAAQRRHLSELAGAPYWRPTGSEWATALALEQRGYLHRDFSNAGRGSLFVLTDAGRAVAERIADA